MSARPFRSLAQVGIVVAVAVWTADPGRALPTTSGDSGMPYVKRFSPKEIGSGPQVVVAARANDGVLYFAANRSVLEYDGVHWRRVGIPTPRALVVDADNRVWVGCDGDLGYLDVDGRELRFVSVRDRLPEADRPTEQVRGIAVFGDAVIVLYTGQLIEWRDGASRSWRLGPDDGFDALAVDGDQLIVAREGRGLVRWTGSLAEPSGTGLDAKISAVVPLGAGRYLAATENGRLWRWDGGEFRPFSPQAEAWIDGHRIQSVVRLVDGRLAVATRGAGLLILDVEGGVDRVADVDHGLASNTVFDVVEDAQGSLWLAQAGGVVRLTNSPISFFGQNGRGPASLTQLTRHDGTLYIGTLDGVHRLVPSTGPEPARFEWLPGLDGGAWHLASTPHGLLVGTDRGIHRVDDDTVVPFGEPGRAIAWHSADGALWATAGADLAVLRPDDGGWRRIAFPGVLPERIAEVVPDDAAATAWLVSIGSRTLYRVELVDGFGEAPRIRPFGLAAPWPRPLRVDGELLFRVGSEVLAYREGALSPDHRFAITEWIPPGEDRYGLKVLADGELWLTMREQLRHIRPSDDGGFEPGERSVVLPARLDFDALPDHSESVLWLATDEGPARFDPRFEPPPTAPPRIRFRPPTDLDDRAFVDGRWVVPHGTGALRFECAAPYFLAEAHNRYRFRLVGLDASWSEWTTEPFKEYTNLDGGDFRFEVQARSGFRDLGTATLAFHVLPPWYATWWARWLLALGLLGVGLMIYRVQQQKLARERLINRRLQAMDRLKDDFLANTSHELRTPLFGMTGLAESLIAGSAGDLPEAATTTLESIVRSGRRLGHLVGDILDVSKLRHGGLVLDPRPVDLHSVVEVVLVLAQGSEAERRLELVNAVPGSLEPIVADENRLQQILHNLVDNAVKFTAEGSVVVSAEAADDHVAVRVRDTGIGIAPDALDRIFESFEQADASIERQYGGTGLGLAVTRELVELHGGTIQVESTVDEGSTFTVTLPRGLPDGVSPTVDATSRDARLDSVAEPPTAVPPSLGHPAAARDSTPDAARPAILVVDDEPINLHILESYLAVEGFEVEAVTDGEQALARLDERSFDLVLLDVMMPRLSGYEVCRILRRRHSLAELPILFLSAKAQGDDAVQGLSVGANDYLTKPISRAELLARIRPHLELGDIHRRLELLVDEKVAQIKTLRGLIPICASCKKIRDDEGYWNRIEVFLERHSEAELTHGICQDCAAEMAKSWEDGQG